MTRRRSGRRVRAAFAACALAFSGLAAVQQTSPTEAVFTDTEFANGTLTAARLQQLTTTCGTSGGLFGSLRDLDVGWGAPAPPAPSGYVITLTRNGATAATFTAGAGSTTYRVGGALLGGLLQSGTYSVAVRSTLGNWVSASSNSFNASLGPVAGWTCLSA